MDKNDMEIEYATSSEIDMCGSLFLPEIIKNIKDKEPVTALTVSTEDMVIGGLAGYYGRGNVSDLFPLCVARLAAHGSRTPACGVA